MNTHDTTYCDNAINLLDELSTRVALGSINQSVCRARAFDLRVLKERLLTYADRSDLVALHAEEEPKYGPDGGQLSEEYRGDLLPPRAILEICALLKKGAERHGDTTPNAPRWRKTAVREHVSRATVHTMEYLESSMDGDANISYLVHAATRLLFAIDCSYANRDTKQTT